MNMTPFGVSLPYFPTTILTKIELVLLFIFFSLVSVLTAFYLPTDGNLVHDLVSLCLPIMALNFILKKTSSNLIYIDY